MSSPACDSGVHYAVDGGYGGGVGIQVGRGEGVEGGVWDRWNGEWRCEGRFICRMICYFEYYEYFFVLDNIYKNCNCKWMYMYVGFSDVKA